MKKIRLSWIDGGVLLFIVTVSVALMVGTLSGSPDGGIKVASKAWSDFGAHIPLVRSFSLGSNFPPVSPLFPGETIRYHFLFYAFAGLLERIGISLDWAINIPSILGMILFLSGLYVLGKFLFGTRLVGILAIVFVLLNGSLSFVNFFATHQLGTSTFRDIIINSRFPSFGPWDNQEVSAFWSLNIFTNQRHLGLSYGIILWTLWCIFTFPEKAPRKKIIGMSLLLSVLVGLLLLLNQAAALILVTWIIWIFAVYPKKRLLNLFAGFFTLPWVALYLSLIAPSGLPVWEPGYLAHSLDPRIFFPYWWKNLGLHLVLIPLGILFAPVKAKKALSVPLLLLFLAPNLIRFSPDMINNHKFFNFYLAVGSFGTGWILYGFHTTLCQLTSRIRSYVFAVMLRTSGLISMGIVCVFLTLSGIIDFFPIVNDGKYEVASQKTNPDIAAYLTLVPSRAIVLNSTFFTNPASLAGRSIYFGYPYFTWSYGYITQPREQLYLAIWRAKNKETACTLARLAHVDFAELSPHPEQYLQPNTFLWNTEFTQIYTNKKTGYTIFDVTKSCLQEPKTL